MPALDRKVLPTRAPWRRPQLRASNSPSSRFWLLDRSNRHSTSNQSNRDWRGEHTFVASRGIEVRPSHHDQRHHCQKRSPSESRSTELGAFRIGGIAKGAGMINPNMATMLCVLATDAVIPQLALRVALRTAVENSFNRITVDGDMSTNHTVILLANGTSGTAPLLAQFQEASGYDTKALARMIV